MILKSLGRKTSNYGQLLAYILKQGEKEPVPPHLIWKQHVMGKTIEEMEREYLENEKNRLYQRKGVNKMYHEWLSISDLDKDRVNDDMLKALALEYGKLRNSSAIIVSAVHKDKDHVHIHFAVSGTELSGKSLRVTKQVFNQIKKDLQAFQIQKFPQLQNSIIDFDKKSKNKIHDKEFKAIEQKGNSDKLILREQLEDVFQSAISKEDFIQKLQEKGITTYARGKLGGVTMENGRNLRFKNLGFDEDRFLELEKRYENHQSISTIREKQSQGRKLNRERLLDEVTEQSIISKTISSKEKSIEKDNKKNSKEDSSQSIDHSDSLGTDNSNINSESIIENILKSKSKSPSLDR